MRGEIAQAYLFGVLSYSSTGTSCYWARLSGTGGTLGEIIANDNVDGQALVTIDPSDFAFETSRCGEWTKVG